MLELKEFDQTDFERYPYVETLGGEIVPMIAEAKMRPPDYEGWQATVVVDGNGIQIMIYDAESKQQMVFCRELYPFPMAVFVAEHLKKPLDLKVLTKLGFEKFK